MNILTHPVHTGYQYDLAGTGHEFHSYPMPRINEIFWDETSRPKPANFHSLQTPPESSGDFDIALAHYPGAIERFRNLGLPIIYKEHCIRGTFEVPPHWRDRISFYSFSSQLAASRWILPKELENRKIIIGMGIDTNTFQGYRGDGGDVLVVSHRVATRPRIKARDRLLALGEQFSLTLVGNHNHGLKGAIGPARNFDELLNYYRTFKVFLNCSPFLGMSTLEALGMGMPVVSFPTINSNIVEHKVTGLLVNSLDEARLALRELLDNRPFALELGRNARARIQERFSPGRFRQRWNTLFAQAANGNS